MYHTLISMVTVMRNVTYCHRCNGFLSICRQYIPNGFIEAHEYITGARGTVSAPVWLQRGTAMQVDADSNPAQTEVASGVVRN